MNNIDYFNYHTDRNIYPFISKNGDINRQFTDAVDDLVLWMPTTCTLPISVSSDIDEYDRLVLYFRDANESLVSSVTDDSVSVVTPDGALAGYIIWNGEHVEMLKSSIFSNNPQPQVDMYVSPSACSYMDITPLSSLYVNGYKTDTIIGSSDDSVKIERSADNVVRIDLYDNTYTKDNPITQIIFPGANEKLPEDVTVVFGDLHGNVWLKSDATCDIRVVTGDNITITEISNDKL